MDKKSGILCQRPPKLAEKCAKMVEDVIQELGKGAFELLDAHEKHLLRLFIWAGCGCHMDLNTVQSGYVAIEKW